MEAIVVLLLIVLLIIVITGNSGHRARHEQLAREIEALREQLRRFVQKEEEREVKVPVPQKSAPDDAQRWAPKPAASLPDPAPSPTPQPLPQRPTSPSPTISEPQPMHAAPPPVPPPPPRRPSFFERNPDLEKFIGENLISKIGIAILVIGIGFFVKYAIDQDWIGPAGRVAIGLLCGGILVGLAHRLQKSYTAFSAVLVGGGLAVFYFSIALAYKDYALFSQPVAFVIMVVITVFAILLSLLYDRQEVAIIALAGGFAVPFLVSNGSGNYVTLFSYLLLLNTGLLVIAYRKAWRLLNFIAFVATVVIWCGWLATLSVAVPRSTYVGGFLFATAFYLLFLAINLAHTVRERKRAIASDFGIILAANALYFSAGLYLLYAAGASGYKGFFSAGLGVLNFALAALLVRRRSLDATILYLLVGITLTFVSVTAPLQLQGHFITLFWAAESVVLLWLLQSSRIRVLQWGLLAVWGCAGISLLIDWVAVYGSDAPLRPLANRGFMTTLFSAGANAALYRLMRRDTDVAPFAAVFSRESIARFFGGAALILLFAAGGLETGHQASHRAPVTGLSTIYLLLYTASFVLTLWGLARRAVLRLHWGLMTVLMTLVLFFYLETLPHMARVHDAILLTGKGAPHFAAHWAGAALIAAIFHQLLQALRARGGTSGFYTLVTWMGAAFAVVFISVEASLLTTAIVHRGQGSLDEIHRAYVRIGLPILWGLCSFAMMWLGMKHKYRPLRIVSLTLFSITLLKLFLFDIREVSVAGKIAAFFSLGVLLLVVSFMYQRLKRIIIEDKPNENAV